MRKIKVKIKLRNRRAKCKEDQQPWQEIIWRLLTMQAMLFLKELRTAWSRNRIEQKINGTSFNAEHEAKVSNILRSDTTHSYYFFSSPLNSL
jgi:hypothetical protein